MSIIAVPIGLLIGAVCSFVFLWTKVPEVFVVVKVRSDYNSSIAKDFVFKSPIVIMSVSCFSAYSVIDAYTTASLAQSSLSYLGYSQRLLIGIGSLVIAGPSSVFVPYFSRLYKENNFYKFTRMAKRTLIALGIIVLIFSIGASLFSRFIIESVFMRGAFDEKAAMGVSRVFSVMMLGFSPMLLVVFLFRMLYCLNEVRVQAIVGIVWVAIYYTGSLLSSKIFGVLGIAYTYSISWVVVFVFCIFMLFSILKSKKREC